MGSAIENERQSLLSKHSLLNELSGFTHLCDSRPFIQTSLENFRNVYLSGIDVELDIHRRIFEPSSVMSVSHSRILIELPSADESRDNVYMASSK